MTLMFGHYENVAFYEWKLIKFPKSKKKRILKKWWGNPKNYEIKRIPLGKEDLEEGLEIITKRWRTKI